LDGEASVAKACFRFSYPVASPIRSCELFFFWRVLSYSQPVGLVELAAEQLLNAASEVERSGTERLSGFRRA